MKNFVFLVAVLVTFSGCSVANRLAPLTSALEAAAFSEQDPMKKLDVLGTSINSALNESITFGSSRKSVSFINQFSKQNDKAITKILSDLEGHIKGMNTLEKLGFYANVAKKPFVRDLIKTVPKVEKKVERKVNSFLLIGKVINFLNPLKKG